MENLIFLKKYRAIFNFVGISYSIFHKETIFIDFSFRLLLRRNNSFLLKLKIQIFNTMPEHSDPEKMVKLGFAKRQLELSSTTVIQMSANIQALIDKLEKNKAKNEKKKQKIMDELTIKCQELEDLQRKNDDLVANQAKIKAQAKGLKKEMNDTIKKVLANMEERFKMLENENERLRAGYESSRSSKNT